MLAVDTQNNSCSLQFRQNWHYKFYINAVENLPNWYCVGEMDAQFMNELYDIPEQGVHGWEKHYVDQLIALEMLD